MRHLQRRFIALLAAAAIMAVARAWGLRPLATLGEVAAATALCFFAVSLVRVGLALRVAAEARRLDWDVEDGEMVALLGDLPDFFLYPPPHRDDVVRTDYFIEGESDAANLAALMASLSPERIANLSAGDGRGAAPRPRIAMPSPRALVRLLRKPGSPTASSALRRLERAPKGPSNSGAVSSAGRISLPDARSLARRDGS